ncbi:MAG TPA: hypothetical protein VM326_01225 [Sphingomicrobium sp.]|jgi:hypothetical protein|nr:hypothetical protein [Sphingomicrobium sp.]
MSWEDVAERAAKARCEAILERIRAAITAYAPGAEVEPTGDGMRISGRGLKRRWLSEAGLRFARRIGR